MPSSAKSTSFACAAGRPRSTLSAFSRPTRSEAIIPEAPQRSAIREMSPIAESGVAIPSIELRDVLLAGLGHRQDVDELVDHVLPQAVVGEHEPEDRDEHDRQREEREEHVERDRGRVLRQAVAEEVLDRLGERPRDPRDHVERPAQETGEPPAVGHGAGLGHATGSLGSELRKTASGVLAAAALLAPDMSARSMRPWHARTPPAGSSTRSRSRSWSWSRSRSTRSCSGSRPTRRSRSGGARC